MERVLGIGGFFFRARKPDDVGRWYKEHLGIDIPPATYDELPWHQEAGPTAFAAFPDNTHKIGNAEKAVNH